MVYNGKEVLKLPKSNKLAKKLISNGLKYDCKLILDSIGKYWLCIPYDREVDNQNSFESKREYVALDPGIRTFQSFYSPERICGEIARNDNKRIYRLCKHLDDLQSRMSAQKSKKRRRIKRAWLRLIQRIKNLVNEVHKKTSRFLTKHFKVILLPKFETSQMVNRSERNIGSKTARAMMTWVCNRTNTKLVIVTEEYTSKTCGKCGNLHANLGSNKCFKCPRCEMKMDRDINAARNIMLKYLSEENLTPTLLGDCPKQPFLFL